MVQSLPLQKGRAVQWRQPEPDKLPSISPGRVGSQRGGRGEQQRERGPAEMTPCSERKYNHYARLTQHGSSALLIRSKKYDPEVKKKNDPEVKKKNVHV